jgi:hypothetical protein
VVPLSKHKRYKLTRYDNLDITRTMLRTVVVQLKDLGFLRLKVGQSVLATSTMEATTRIIDLIQDLGVSNHDFERLETEEVIILSRRSLDPDQSWAYEPRSAPLRTPYEDTPRTAARQTR